MHPDLAAYVPVADALAALLRPHAEAVIHDLRAGTVHHIANAFSRRSPGDSSLTELQDIRSLDQSVIGPYVKTNWDGRRLKSVSAVLKDQTGQPAGLLCINLDVSMFDALQTAVSDFLRVASSIQRPSVLFQNDWREEVNAIVGDFLVRRGTTADALTVADRAVLVAKLDARGLFDVRNAAPYVARLLKLSRATLYKTLKAVRSGGVDHDLTSAA